jgi:hypothetical protein
MGRTIPSFRIAVVLEEENWKLFRKYLRNKNEKKLFTHMFSIANLYNSACSNAVNPIRIHPIMMSIILHHYKMLKERTSSFDEFDNSSNDHNNDIYDYNNIDSTILKKEIDKWYNFFFVLRKKNRMLFKEMLRSSYKYSDAINAKGKENSTESLFITLIFEQYKLMLPIFLNNKIDYFL